MLLRLLIGFVFVTAATAPSMALPFCESSNERDAARFRGTLAQGNTYDRAFAADWRFMLVPATKGWVIRVFDAEGLDLTQMTPFRGINARDIVGWHFRNRANTGPNEGEINAPQKLRLFFFDPALSGTGGFKPSDAIVADGPGRGALEIRELSLTPRENGEKAGIRRISFDACLSWPRDLTPVKAITEADAAALSSCALPDGFDPVVRLDPPVLRGDWDGDGQADIAGQLRRLDDGKNGVALCMGDGRVVSAGFGDAIGRLDPVYFERLTHWSRHSGRVDQGVGEGSPPDLARDAILLGKEGASSVLLYWTGSGLAAYWQGD